MNKLFFVFLPLLLLSCGNSSTNGSGSDGSPLSDANALKYRSCSKDSDCTYTNNGCCDCANGGKDIAVNTKALTDFRTNFNCQNVACTMLAAVPACGTGTIACKSNLCEYTRATSDSHGSPVVPNGN
ncbi:MAG: hypothetical protein WCQ53_03145 [bacterium]